MRRADDDAGAKPPMHFNEGIWPFASVSCNVCVCKEEEGVEGLTCGRIVTTLKTFAGSTSVGPVEYVIQNQANDYLPSPQALTQF